MTHVLHRFKQATQRMSHHSPGVASLSVASEKLMLECDFHMLVSGFWMFSSAFVSPSDSEEVSMTSCVCFILYLSIFFVSCYGHLFVRQCLCSVKKFFLPSSLRRKVEGDLILEA